MSTTTKNDSGCFSCILRRLFCQGSQQTYPSDQVAEPEEAEFNKQPKKASKPEAQILTQGAPGIVARLMGLDSLPEASWDRKENALDSVTRSKSVNFMDYLLQLDLAQAHQHRRVRTSVSFREVPTLLHKQNPELHALYLDEVHEKKKRESKVRKTDEDFGELKQKKEETCENKKERMAMKKKEKQSNSKKISKFIDEPRRVSVKRNCNSKTYGESGASVKKKNSVKRMNQSEVLAKSKVSKSKNRQSVEAAECSSENSSPISVLDVNEFAIYDDYSLSDPRCVDLNFKRRSSSKTMYSDCLSANSKLIDDLKLRVVKKKDYESINYQITEYYKEMVAGLCHITEESIMQSNWMLKSEEFEEICMQIGQHILDSLLQQVVDELVGFNTAIFAL
ncbi:uncharacterized protein LOC123216585 isoform X2 [Mangifera indica]|uniref:uncharacterized protein LOC123216585 isoform X2 n=1 Tax=Mangifera indica TaxID=29780 RepID=UPI001CFA17EC|nr:uncharacterized protein LOC123216585 isoform X2 [Mangifera indica]